MSARAPSGQLPNLMRGVAGGVLLGVPLLYTQEVWDHGQTLESGVILALLVVAFGLGAALSFYVGFRPGRTHRPFEDAIVGFGISIVLAFLLLLLLDRIQLDMPVENLLGVVALTSVPIGIGFAIGNALAPKEGGEGSERSAAGRAICSPRRPEPSSSRSTSRRPRSRSVSGKSSTGSA